MAAPNAQPFGSRGGMAAPHEHDVYEAGNPGGTAAPTASHSGESGVAKHGTPKPVGAGKKNPLK